MNRWQIAFTVFGIVSTVVLALFPPQFVTGTHVRYLFVSTGLPIDWFRLFLWFVAILCVTGLGVAVNKEEHH